MRSELRLDKGDLRRPVLAHQPVDLGDVARLTAHHQSEVIGGEARAVGLVELEPRELAHREQADHGHHAAEQDGELEGDDRIRRDRREGLATQHDLPVVGHPERQGVAGHAPEQAADQREQAHAARLGIHGVVELVGRDRRVDLDFCVAAPAQLLRYGGHGERLFEDAEESGHQ
jgi:hypothetical protein